MLNRFAFVLIGVLVSTSSFASSIVCGEKSARNYSFSVKFGLPGQEATAKLKVPGEKSARKMSCAVPAVSLPRPGGFDRTRPVVFCGEDGDYGYSVRVSAGGLAGTLAYVMAQGKFDTKAKQVTILRCERE